ncbi:MAG: coproporphyrinogen III oxidase, partial [Muribaculaceae bacterium]|nr:coproporphyrinogen III oxidase [Muribaculaceae bacterium]
GEEENRQMYEYAKKVFKDNGYEHYEISNFAKPEHRAIHNSAYWKYAQYLGLGVSAHSFDGRLRRVNPIGINNYIESIRRGKTYYQIERETESELYNDYIITSLRTVDGLDIKKLRSAFGEKWGDFFCKSATRHIQSGKLICDGDVYRIEESSWLLSDAVLRDLIYVD